ncbi:restriction endonuclease subunit S [Mucilaginibacter angelicae]|uniref:Restriction endonuclease subunit S n=1 Tax=Mucilaginibacter angelicae TaxID=869718 RepID=A0ABV6L7A5_9SPHI
MQKLNQVSSILSGYTFRDSLDYMEDGPIHVIQPKNLKLISDAPCIDLFQNYEKYLLSDGDILITIKGSANTVTQLTLPDKTKYVCSAAFAVIRPSGLKTCSTFLSWYLQCETAQETLRAMQKGTTVQNLSLKDLQNLPIPSLPLHIQQTIGELANLEQQRISILQDLASKRKTLLDHELMKLVKAGGQNE